MVHYQFPQQFLPQQPAQATESQQQRSANDAAAFVVINAFKEKNPHAPEPDQPKAAGGSMGGRIEGDLEVFFDDEGLTSLINEESDGKACDGGVSSSSTAGQTVDQIMARVPPTVSLE